MIQLLKKIRFRVYMWVKFLFILPDYIRFRGKDSTKHCPTSIFTVYPRLSDKTAKTPFEKQYIYHIAWAARCIKNNNPRRHTDFGSLLHFSVLLSAFIPVDFYDYRPAEIMLSGLDSKFGDLQNIALPAGSIESVSCMHTIEHIGLGRYGDPIDPEGDLKAITELKRIVQQGGALLIVVPLGTIQRTEFNGHRVYHYDTFLSYFKGFSIIDFSYIPQSDDRGGIIMHTDGNAVGNDSLGCGCFWFKKDNE